MTAPGADPQRTLILPLWRALHVSIEGSRVPISGHDSARPDAGAVEASFRIELDAGEADILSQQIHNAVTKITNARRSQQ